MRAPYGEVTEVRAPTRLAMHADDHTVPIDEHNRMCPPFALRLIVTTRADARGPSQYRGNAADRDFPCCSTSIAQWTQTRQRATRNVPYPAIVTRLWDQPSHRDLGDDAIPGSSPIRDCGTPISGSRWRVTQLVLSEPSFAAECRSPKSLCSRMVGCMRTPSPVSYVCARSIEFPKSLTLGYELDIRY